MTEISVQPNETNDKLEDEDREDENNESETNSLEKQPQEDKPINNSAGAVLLRKWLNKTLRVEMSDGRILMGVFLCTDRDANIILGSCSEYLPSEEDTNPDGVQEEARILGLVMVPGKHIVTICIDQIEVDKKDSMGLDGLVGSGLDVNKSANEVK